MKSNIIKKICLMLVLIIIIGLIVFVAINSSTGKKETKVSNKTSINKDSVKNESSSKSEVNVPSNAAKEVTITELEDGVKYSLSEENIKPDIVIGEKFFGTQLNDINLNFSKYEGKTIEIEGLYFDNPPEPYTFVGRFSTNIVCADCPVGYSYFEYEWHGDKKIPNLKDSEVWLKIIGTLKKGNDGGEYYYIDASSIEIMNNKGLETVSN